MLYIFEEPYNEGNRYSITIHVGHDIDWHASKTFAMCRHSSIDFTLLILLLIASYCYFCLFFMHM